MEFIYLIIAITAGFAIGYLLLRNQSSSKISELLSQKNVAEGKVNDLLAQKQKSENDAVQQNEKILQLTGENSSSKNALENLQQKLVEQKADFENLQERFTKEFENLANRIFDAKGKTFAEQNKQNLDQLLKPFQEKIKDFEKKVEDAYDKELRDKVSLREEVRKLYELNTKLSIEATNLTKALKGDTKKQGDWGEMILEKIFESSGLRKDIEYKKQVVTQNQEGASIKPDFVVILPDDKHLIVDAKVSLTAYDRCIFCEDDIEREKHLRDHVNSVRTHVRALSDKGYYAGTAFQSPDFVLLFMPLESAFSLAVQADSELFYYAWERRIVIVSPTTLLATLRTVSSLWKIESQNKNAMEIARLSGAMYDKLVGFIEDMINVGKQLDTVEKSYKGAMNKLHEGGGNVIRTAEKVKALGAKTSKSLPQSLIDRADE
ncbi:MAG TPA: DNA recombination protein RmuC [Chitinophagales bacterium]|nr:DNA recombination protein RmuC [Chitinophagales bacterium]